MIKQEKFPSAEQRARETLDRMAYALAEAKTAVEADASKTLLEVFPEPSERRTDTKFLLPADKEEAFRSAMARLGIGREATVSASETGLSNGYVAVVEGGLGHKIAAELSAVLSDDSIRPSIIVIAATPDRVLPPLETDKAREREYAAKIIGKDPSEIGDTEYDVAKQIVESLPGFAQSGPEEFAGVEPGAQQFIEFGTIVGAHGSNRVFLMPIIREQLEGGRYKQPGTREILKIIDTGMRQSKHDADIGFVTSATYQPSRETDVVSAMLEISRAGQARNIGVITYGTAELAAIKGEPIPQPPAIGQLAGEAYKATQQVEVLRNLLLENQ